MSEPNVHDVALVFEGGGMRGSLTAGVVVALLEAEVHLGWAAGISAGSSHVCNYVSRDADRARVVFTDFAADPQFGNVRTWLRGEGLFHSRYIYEQSSSPGQAIPLDLETFLGSGTEPRIVGFRASDGAQVVWGREDMRTLEDLAVRVRASSTMPLVMPPTLVDGEVFVDGALGDSGGIPLNVAKAEGYEKFLVVLSQERTYVRRPMGHARFLRRRFREHPAIAEALLTRHERYEATREEVFELERQGRAIVFAPDHMPVRNGERNVLKLRAAHELGLAQARREMPAWKEFLGL